MMEIWWVIICAIFSFLLGFYTNAFMVSIDRKELKRTFEVELEKEHKTGKWIKDIYGNVFVRSVEQTAEITVSVT